MNTSSQILWSVSYRAFCKQGLFQGRACGVLAPQTELPPTQIRLPTLFQSAPVSTPLGRVIAAANSLGSEVLRLAIEATRTLKPLASRIFRRGPLLICNGGLHPTTAGRFSISRFLRALRVLQDFVRQGTDLLHYNQVLSSAPNHAHKKAWSYEHDEQGNPAIRAIGV